MRRLVSKCALGGLLVGLGPDGLAAATDGTTAAPNAPVTVSAASKDLPRARIHSVSDARATSAFIPEPSIVRGLVDRGLMALSGKTNLTAAWRVWVQPTDVVGFKVLSAPGALTGTRPAVVEALVDSLIRSGQSASKIVIWDRQARDLKASGFQTLADRLGIRCVATTDAGWDGLQFYESAVQGKLVFGDLEFGKGDRFAVGRRSHVSRLLTKEVTRIIPVTPILTHHSGGIYGHLLSLAFGSVDNMYRFESDPGRTEEAVPEICALDDLMPKVAFGVTDALVGQVRGDDKARLHDTIALNELRFGADLVALDIATLSDVTAARKAYPIDGERALRTDLFVNAELLELGVAQTNRVEIVKVRP
ncbi:MAG: hypothetical protein FJ396_03585 [Verrucomicrobia bacterium]|nr:hypothetical protein [Verrucomicrobiota bacterium]